MSILAIYFKYNEEEIMKEFWSYEVDDILKQLNTDKGGLSSREAEERMDEY